MRIVGTEMTLASSHALSARREVTESLRAWVGPRRPDFEGREARRPAPPPAPPPAPAKAAKETNPTAIDQAVEAADGDPMLSLLRTMIEAMTGIRIKVFRADDLAQVAAPPELRDPKEAASNPSARGPAGFGVEYDYHEVREEHEATAFAASGVVRTADGQEIEFQVSLAMSRSYREESNVSLRLGDARRKDPLVINFSGSAAQLTEARFAFDLDADGQTESLPGLASGSGFLVFDRNGNAKADDGSELLGPQSGDGFAELARLDEDGNGWIDEGDAAFQRLYVWSPDADGGGALRSLTESDVGAVAVNAVETPFELRSANNSSLGAVRATSVYLKESGGASSVQQIDLSV